MQKFIIWDQPGSPCANEAFIVFWRSFSTFDIDRAVSVPLLVEINSDLLRDRYLGWIYDIGKTCVGGKTIIERLQIRSEFSAWWFSLLSNKCNWASSPYINDVIRLLAFVDWLDGQHSYHLVFVSANRNLAMCLQDWCLNNDVHFVWRNLNSLSFSSVNSFHLFSYLPYIFRSFIWFFTYLSSRWALKGSGLDAWKKRAGDITFISYLFNLKPGAAVNCIFNSNYWGPLPEKLRNESHRSKWLHLYIPHSDLPSAAVAAALVKNFNDTEDGLESHCTLDTFLSVPIVCKTIREFLSLFRMGSNILMHDSIPKLNGLNLWPIFRSDWYRSIAGKHAIENILYLNLFESAFSCIPKQRIGFYLNENIPWQFSLLYAWKLYGHGSIVGYLHSTICFWDLRHFFDRRSYSSVRLELVPMPTFIAGNGELARQKFINEGFYPKKWIELEALRYMYLNDLIERRRNYLSSKIVCESSSIMNPTLLVLGDYSRDSTQLQLQILREAYTFLPSNLFIIFKPHPACQIDYADYQDLQISFSLLPLSELLEKCTISYVGPMSSAAVDSFCAGVPVVALINAFLPNMSPLLGFKGISFVETPMQLAMAVHDGINLSAFSPQLMQVFNTNIELTAWKKLLLGG